ncbi:MAG: 3-oxoacyl-[acyl-carrier-protein] reductase [Candidatus Thermoplasmatota archaeon]
MTRTASIEVEKTGALDGRTALVTGASRGIGRAIAVALAREGARVGINYVENKGGAAETLDIILREGGRGDVFQADVGDAASVDSLREDVHACMGRIDILVNNAGINRDHTIKRMEASEWNDVIRVDLTGVFNVTQAFLDDLVASRHGRIVNVSSIVGEKGNFGQANYAAAKAGVLGFTRALALELARDGVTVNAVVPGFIETDMVRNMPEAAKQAVLEQIPLGRFGKPEDVAAAVSFLTSDDASYMTGATLRVNGGQHV